MPLHTHLNSKYGCALHPLSAEVSDLVITTFPTEKHHKLETMTNSDHISPEMFLRAGREIYRTDKTIKRTHAIHCDVAKFRGLFGTVPYICSVLWGMVNPLVTIHPKTRICHLLWALLLMKDYSTEVQNGPFVAVHDKT